MAIKICLDAGHYGKYNRSPAVPAYYESDMNWKLHLLLKEELESYGIEVSVTRSNKDKDMGLQDRGKCAKGCDLFLSVHSNGVDTKKYTKEQMEAIDYPVAYVPINGSGDALGEKLAKCVESIMGTKQKGRAESRKGSGDWDYYGVIYGAVSVGVPGIILEHSFHSNTRSTNWLLNDNNLEKLAEAEAKVIAEHFGIVKPVAPATEWYRVRKAWDDKDSQIGAFKDLTYAKSCADQNPGYYVYDENGTCVYPVSTTVTVELPVLQMGCEGNSVKALQVLLTGLGFSCGVAGVDGIFGANTKTALEGYQASRGLEAFGVCDEQTWKKLLL